VLPLLLGGPGPAFLLVQLEIGDRREEIPRVSLHPEAIAARLRQVAAGSD